MAKSQVPAEIFKAYDVRGKVGEELTKTVANTIGQAFGVWLPAKGAVAVGRDMRPDSAELVNGVIEGLRSQGRDVVDIGEVTSDMIYFAVGHLNLAGGAMVTASHNPGEYNGIKFCMEQAKPVGIDTGLMAIRDLAVGGELKPAAAKGNYKEKDIIEAWIQHSLNFIDVDVLKPLKIVVDAGNGMAGKIFPELEPYVPFDVEELYFELDGTFPNHIANPLEEKNMADLKQAIKKTGAQAGLAFDGDGDRAVLVDETGQSLSGTVMTSMLADYFLKKVPGATILCNAICGQAAFATISKNGGQAFRTKVGHSFIKADMRKYDAIFAGEHSGHYYFKDNFSADSGLIAAVIGLFILSVSGKKLSQLAEPFRRGYYQISETNFTVDDKDSLLKQIAEDFKDGKQETLDGLTVRYSTAWFNLRPSNTEPLLRLNAEASSQTELDQLVAKVKATMKV